MALGLRGEAGPDRDEPLLHHSRGHRQLPARHAAGEGQGRLRHLLRAHTHHRVKVGQAASPSSFYSSPSSLPPPSYFFSSFFSSFFLLFQSSFSSSSSSSSRATFEACRWIHQSGRWERDESAADRVIPNSHKTTTAQEMAENPHYKMRAKVT